MQPAAHRVTGEAGERNVERLKANEGGTYQFELWLGRARTVRARGSQPRIPLGRRAAGRGAQCPVAPLWERRISPSYAFFRCIKEPCSGTPRQQCSWRVGGGLEEHATAGGESQREDACRLGDPHCALAVPVGNGEVGRCT